MLVTNKIHRIEVNTNDTLLYYMFLLQNDDAIFRMTCWRKPDAERDDVPLEEA